MPTITFIIGLIALIAALPFALKFFIYILYRPKFEIGLQGETINIFLRDKRRLDINIRFVSDTPLNKKEEAKHFISGIDMTGAAKSKNRFVYKSISSSLPGYSTLGFTFPFEPGPEKCTVDIMIYPKVHLSEFGLPLYFGDVDLKPVVEILTINPQAE